MGRKRWKAKKITIKEQHAVGYMNLSRKCEQDVNLPLSAIVNHNRWIARKIRKKCKEPKHMSWSLNMNLKKSQPLDIDNNFSKIESSRKRKEETHLRPTTSCQSLCTALLPSPRPWTQTRDVSGQRHANGQKQTSIKEVLAQSQPKQWN